MSQFFMLTFHHRLSRENRKQKRRKETIIALRKCFIMKIRITNKFKVQQLTIIREITSPLSKRIDETEHFNFRGFEWVHCTQVLVCTYFGIHLLFVHLKSVSLLQTGQFSANSSLLSLQSSCEHFGPMLSRKKSINIIWFQWFSYCSTQYLSITEQPLRYASIVGLARTSLPAGCTISLAAHVSWLVRIITTWEQSELFFQ